MIFKKKVYSQFILFERSFFPSKHIAEMDRIEKIQIHFQ
jgi:hypothetical protein